MKGSALSLLVGLLLLPFLGTSQDSLLHTFPREVMWVNFEHTEVSFSPTSKYMAFGDKYGKFYIYETTSGTLIHQDRWTETQPILVSLFSADEKYLVAGTGAGAIILFDLVNKKIERVKKVHKRCLKTMVFSADGKTLYTGGNDKVIHAWNFPDFSRPEKTFKPGIGKIHSIILDESQQLMWIGTHHAEHSLALMDLGTSELVRTVNSGNVYDIEWLPQQNRLAVATSKKHLYWLEATDNLTPSQELHNNGILSVGAWPGTEYFATCSFDKTWVVRSNTGEEIYRMNLPSAPKNFNFSPDGRFLALQVDYERLQVFDLSKIGLSR